MSLLYPDLVTGALLLDDPTDPGPALWSSRARWRTKPPASVGLDVSHPSCPDYCWPFNTIVGTPKPLCRSQQLTDPGGSTVSGTTGWMQPGPSQYGPGVRHGATTDRTVLAIAAEADKVVGLSAFTLLIATRKTDATLRNSTIFGYDTLTGANRCQMHAPFSDGNVYFDYGGSATGGGGRCQVIAPTFGDDLWCFNVGSRGMEIWQNGVLRATDGAISRGTGGGGATGTVGFPANPSFSDLNDTSLVMTWTRQLTAAEILALSSNPWQVFQPQSRPMIAGPWSARTPEGPALYLPTVRGRWTRKPVPGTQLDPTHPHCPDFCWPFLSPSNTPQALTRNIHPAQPFAPVGTPTFSPGGKYGLSLRHTANTDITRFTSSALEADAIIPPGNGGFTVMVASRKTDGTFRPCTGWGVDGALNAGQDCYLLIGFDNGTLKVSGFRFAGAVAGTTSVEVPNTSITFGDDIWVGTTGPRGIEFWQNGILLGSNPGSNPSRTSTISTCTTGACAIAWPAGNPNFGDLADLAFVMTWRRQLSPEVIRSLYVNPWQVFQPPSFGLFAGAVPEVVSAVGRFPALWLAP